AFMSFDLQNGCARPRGPQKANGSPREQIGPSQAVYRKRRTAPRGGNVRLRTTPKGGCNRPGVARNAVDVAIRHATAPDDPRLEHRALVTHSRGTSGSSSARYAARNVPREEASLSRS